MTAVGCNGWVRYAVVNCINNPAAVPIEAAKQEAGWGAQWGPFS